MNVNPEDLTSGSCPFTYLPVLGMFECLQQQLDAEGILIPGLDVHNDKDLGHITDYRSGRAAQGGLFGSTVSDCCAWLNFDNLTLLAPH